MKLFYFGSVCAQSIFNETVSKSKVKPSASAQNFEYALIKGFSQNQDVDLTVVSAESIAMFPKGNRLILKARKDILTENVCAQIVPALNVPFFKQKNHANGVYKRLVKWLKENQREKEKAVLLYGLYPNVAKKIKKACTQYNCKAFAIITDIPKTMFTYTKSSLLKKLFGKKYRETAIQLQNAFDGYIYLTEAMHEEIAPQKPYTVVETIADINIFDGVRCIEKAKPAALMYAGALYEKYGLDKIIQVFEYIKTDAQLWFFGSGDYEQTIREKQSQNPKIHFFGRVDRATVSQKETEASLLLNIRNPQDEYTKYSFPSKMIEYMLSGTPLVTTKLEGIPKEYTPYVYYLDYENPETMAKQIDCILAKSQEENLSFGKKASDFVKAEKNCITQAERIVSFLKQELIKD